MHPGEGTMPETLEKVLLLILGWLFGLLSPAIIAAIQRRRAAKALKATFLRELDEIRYHLVQAIHLLNLKLGTTTPQGLDWLQVHFSEFSDRENMQTALSYIQMAKTLSPEAFQDHIKQKSGEETKVAVLKRYDTPVLESNLTLIHYLSNELQSKFMEIHLRLNILNQITDEHKMFFKLSLQGPSFGPNFDLTLDNMIKAQSAFRLQAIWISDAIREVKLALAAA
jgi:hypothetical protein